jgi:uncharacterized protein YhfF/DNA-binding CsgD family transcriptional regulator
VQHRLNRLERLPNFKRFHRNGSACIPKRANLGGKGAALQGSQWRPKLGLARQGVQAMHTASTEAFWRAYCGHEGVHGARHAVTLFRTEPDVADRLLDRMLAGTMRAAVGPRALFGAGGEEPLPRAGDYAVLVDRRKRPRLIWRTTDVRVAPLSSVDSTFVWRHGTGDADCRAWLRRLEPDMAGMARACGVEMHNEIETVFETLEVVWPREVARRTKLVASHLDRSIAALHRVDHSDGAAAEAILAQVHTAVLTVGPGLRVGLTNPSADVLLRRGDGLRLRHGHLEACSPGDERALMAAVTGACGASGSRPRSEGPARAVGVLISVGRGEDRPPYRVSVLPLRPDHPARAPAPGAQAILFVDDPERDAAPSQAALYVRAFELTPAEARLAVHLAAGASLTEAADAFGVTRNTVRAQLRAIFDKTDTHRQLDLVRLLQGSGSLRVRLV